MRTKKLVLPALLLALSLCLFAGCSFAGDTTTDHARNYVYASGEPINFYDETNDREPLGTLTFLSAHTLSDQEFVHKIENVTDGEGNSVPKEEIYRQVVQINYTYEKTAAGKNLRQNAFSVRDASGGRALLNPDTDYERLPVEAGIHSMIAALPERSDNVTVSVLYSGRITPNAMAELAIGGSAAKPRPLAAAPNNPQPVIDLLEKELDAKQQALEELQARNDDLRAQLDKANRTAQMYLVLAVTGASVILMTLLQALRRRGKSKPANANSSDSP